MQTTALRQTGEIRAGGFTTWMLRLTRMMTIALAVMILIPDLNPVRVLKEINFNASLFTTAISSEPLMGNIVAMVWKRGVLTEDMFYALMHISQGVLAGLALCALGACLSLGNNLMKWVSTLCSALGSAAVLLCMWQITDCYEGFAAITAESELAAKYITPTLDTGRLIAFAAAAGLNLLGTVLTALTLPRRHEGRFGMDEKFRLLLMFLPVLVLTFIFCYLPLYGWRFAFFDYQAGKEMTMDSFMGFEYFRQLFGEAAYRSDLVRVLRNTLVMSGLGIATSWLPIAFAILLAELRSSRMHRIVQTLTTIPNFISWVLVYSIALCIFSTEGFINSIGVSIFGDSYTRVNYLMGDSWIWVKMLLWGTWKGLGWSAIVYIAGIAGIDQQLYEAAKVDGANRWQCIRHITIPGLVPTYMVMLLMSVAGILSNGMEQYLVFENSTNTQTITVLDLYVYYGIQSSIEMSTIIGMFKSVIGVVLLFGANGISKAVRGESIV